LLYVVLSFCSKRWVLIIILRKFFVGNLNYDTIENDLKEAFSKAGKVVEAKIVRRGNRSKGYGFVEFENEEDAKKSVELLDKFELHERSINVQLSTSSGTKVGREEGGRDNYGNYDNYDNYDNRDNRDNRGPMRQGFRSNYRNNYRNNYDNDNSYGRGPTRGRKIYFLRNNYNDGPRRNNYNDGPRRNFNGGRYGPPRRNFNNNRPQRSPNTEKVESKTTIFVANLPFSYDDEGLIELFSKCGQIRTAHVVRNRGRSKGFGFVEFESQEGQQNALKTLDNFSVSYKNGDQKVLSVKVAMTEKEKPETQTQTQTQDQDS